MTAPQARLIRAAEAEAWQDGFAFLDTARAEAETIREDARLDAAFIRDRAADEGRRKGEAEAAEQLLRTHDRINRYLAGIEPRIVDLVADILRDVLGGMDDADLVARAARRALASFREKEGITLSVPPDLVDGVERHLADRPDLRIAPDRLLTGRQCTLTSAVSSIDISVDAQIDALRAAMAQ